MKQLIIQFRTEDFQGRDCLGIRHELEEKIEKAFGSSSEDLGFVDGGDIGKEEMNIFVLVNAWDESTELVKAVLKRSGHLDLAIIAKRMEDDSYEVVWPLEFDEAFTIT
jgi:hypothetical protein